MSSASHIPAAAEVNAGHHPNDNVVILLATHNGARFITQQIVSIQTQTHQHWRLLISDDNSTDNTVELITRLAEDDARISFVRRDSEGRSGAAAHFGDLMRHACNIPVELFCFCDQDDIWLREKLQHSVALARQLEQSNGKRQPLLVYSDLELIDADARALGKTYYAHQGIRRANREPPFGTLMVQNHIAGCTTLFNRALLELATPLPDCAYMHDWWLALCAGTAGKIAYLATPTVLYRQHQNNAVGAGGLSRAKSLTAIRNLIAKMNRIYRQSVAQAQALAKRTSAVGSCDNTGKPRSEESAMLTQWGQTDVTRTRRLLFAWKSRLHSQNMLLTLILYFQILFVPTAPRQH